MLKYFRTRSRTFARHALALVALLWVGAAMAPCLMLTPHSPHCAGMDPDMPCVHMAAPTHDTGCDAALDCAQADSRAPAPAAFNFAVPLLVLLAVIAPPLVRMLPGTSHWAAPDRQRAPDPPLHLQLARLLT